MLYSIFYLLIIFNIAVSSFDICEDEVSPNQCSFFNLNWGSSIAIGKYTIATCGSIIVQYQFPTMSTIQQFRPSDCAPFINPCYCQCVRENPGSIAVIRYAYGNSQTTACINHDQSFTGYTHDILHFGTASCKMHVYGALYPKINFFQDGVTSTNSLCQNRGVMLWTDQISSGIHNHVGVYQQLANRTGDGCTDFGRIPVFPVSVNSDFYLDNYMLSAYGSVSFPLNCSCVPTYLPPFCVNINCNQQNNCPLNACGQPNCFCSNHGKMISFIDPLQTGTQFVTEPIGTVCKCLCDDGYAGLNCEFFIGSGNCANGQLKGTNVSVDWMRTGNGIVRPTCVTTPGPGIGFTNTLVCPIDRGLSLCGVDRNGKPQCVCSTRYLVYDPVIDTCVPRQDAVPPQDLGNCIF